MTLHFVQLTLGNKNYKNKVPTEGCTDLADFKGAIKKNFSPYLDSYGLHHLTIFKPDGITEIDPETLVTDLIAISWKPMMVAVEELPVEPATGRSRKQLTYKGLGVEISCRKYFDALAQRLALFYRFKWGPDDENDYPTFDDVLYAYKNKAWNHITRYNSFAERTDEPESTQVAVQVPILSIRLPDIFDHHEWTKLNEWNQKTNSRIHDAALRKIRTGKYFVIIPHSDCSSPLVIPRL